MSAKLFGNRRAAAAPRALLLLAIFGTLGALGAVPACRQKRGVLTPPGVAVDEALQSHRFAEGFRKLGRSHLRSTVHFAVGIDGGATDNVTTETDVWMDDKGNWRLVDLNDKDGGREVVLHGRELAIALRYGRMIRRPAEDPEPLRLLAQGVGGPFAAWDLLRDVATIDDFGGDTHGGRKVHVFKLTKAPHPPAPAPIADGGDRQAWRRTVVAEKVEGTVMIDEQLGIPLLAEIHATYTMRRGEGAGTPMHGVVDARTSIEEIGSSPEIAEPEAEDLAPRQRTIPDERAMLGGLPRAPARPRGAP
ncbi:MAG TPA: hypothetical protein VGP07_05490 [Polyangia bacterium]